MTQHTGASYDGIAGKYAETVDVKPWNAYYERPAVISLLPSLINVKALDAGCGSGWYAEQLLSREATVTAFDLNSEFVALTRSRVGALAHGNQKVTRNDPCITRALRAAFTCPKAVLTCCIKVAEVGLSSYRAVVFTPENWVWLKTLYISHRSCK